MNLDESPFQLPSQGRFYDGKIPDGTVTVRRMTVGEDMLIQSTSGGLDLVTKLISACVKLPNGFDCNDLLVTDRFALLIALRVATFGPKYSLSYDCQSCSSKCTSEVDLNDDLAVRNPTAEAHEPVRVFLPDAQKTVTLRFLRAKDEDAVGRAIQRARQSNQPDVSLIARMAHQLVAVDDSGFEKYADKERFVATLGMADGQDWRDTMDELEPGIDLVVKRDCPKCGSINNLILPMGLEFFRSTRRRSVKSS